MVFTFAKSRRLFYQFLMVGIILIPNQALAGFSFDLTGSGTKSAAGATTNNDSAVTAGVGVDLGDHFQLGLSYRVSNDNAVGLRAIQVGNQTGLVDYESDTRTVIKALNLAIILYNGIVSPYVFGGIAHHEYYFRTELAGQMDEDRKVVPQLINYGGGFTVYLNQNFGLKISQTFSPGEKLVVTPDYRIETKKVLNSYLEVGVRYRL